MWRRQISTVFYLRKRVDVCSRAVVHSEPFARSARCPRKPTPTPKSDANYRTPSSALSSRESSRARSFPDPSSCGVSSRSSSNNDWPAQGHSLKESVLAHELYGKGTDFDGGADPVVRVDARRLRDKLREVPRGPIRSRGRSRCRRAATYRSSKRIPPHPLTRLLPLFHPSRSRPLPEAAADASVPNVSLSRARIAVSALAVVVAVIVAALYWRTLSTGERSSPTAPPGFVPRRGGAASVVPGRQPRRLRVVGRRRPWTDRYLCESRRE